MKGVCVMLFCQVTLNNIIIQIFHCITVPKQALVITSLQFKPLENTAGKGEIARIEQFFPFPTMFSILKDNSAISTKFKIVVCKLCTLEESKFRRLGKS